MDARLFITPETLAMDLNLQDGALAVDEGLSTAVAVSVFTDRRAGPDDRLPGDETDRRGWWGDAFPAVIDGARAGGDRIGSRLWLLSREKIVPETLRRAETYIAEALQWMIDDGVAERIDVTVEARRPNILAFGIVIHRASGENPRFDFLWDAQFDNRSTA